MSDEQLKAKTNEFKERYQNGESLERLLPEAFATVREDLQEEVTRWSRHQGLAATELQYFLLYSQTLFVDAFKHIFVPFELCLGIRGTITYVRRCSSLKLLWLRFGYTKQ